MKRRNFIGLSAAAASVYTARGGSMAHRETPILSFGLITDVQYADAEPEGERHYRSSLGKLKTAVNWLAPKKLPFTLHLGDLIDRDFKAFSTVLALLEGLGHPTHHLLGNHDYTVAEGEKGRVVSTIGMPHDYYQFASSGVRFVMLDSNDLSIYKYPAGSPQDLKSEAILKQLMEEKSNNGKPWNGGVSEIQLQWLDDELTAADAADERVILCGHHPLLPADGNQAWNSDGILKVIDQHPSVTAYFNGHFHDGAQVLRKGIPYITFKSILHQPEINAFSAVHLYADRMEIEGNGRETSRVVALQRL